MSPTVLHAQHGDIAVLAGMNQQQAHELLGLDRRAEFLNRDAVLALNQADGLTGLRRNQHAFSLKPNDSAVIGRDDAKVTAKGAA